MASNDGLISKIFIALGIDATGVGPGMGKAAGATGRGFKKISRQGRATTRVIGALRGQILALGGAFGVAFGASAAIRGALSAIRSFDSLAKSAKNLGVSVKFLFSLQHAAKLAGIEAAAVSNAVQRATRRLGEFASTGGGVAKVALDLLGAGLSDAVKQGQTFEQLLPRLADAFADLHRRSPADAIRASFSLFDTENVRTGTILLGQGADALGRAMSEGAALGDNIEVAARKAEELSDAFTRIEAEWQSVVASFVVGFGGDILTIMQQWSTAIREISIWTKGGRQPFLVTPSDVVAADKTHPTRKSRTPLVSGGAPMSGGLAAALGREGAMRRAGRKTPPPSVKFPGPHDPGPAIVGTMGPPLPPWLDTSLTSFERWGDPSGYEAGGFISPAAGQWSTQAEGPEHLSLPAVPTGGGLFPGLLDSGIAAVSKFSMDVKDELLAGDWAEALVQPFQDFNDALKESEFRFGDFGEAMQLQLFEMQVTADEWAATLLGMVESFSGAVGSMIAVVATSSEGVAEQIKGIMKALVKSFIATLVTLAVQQAIFWALGKALGMKSFAGELARASGLAAAWYIVASVRELGLIGAVTGPATAKGFAALVAGIGATIAAVGLAEGGVVTSPTLALIGEAGPEAVIPLSHGGLGATVQLILDGDVLGEAMVDLLPGAITRAAT